MEDHNILVGTPAYHGQVHIDYVESVISFQRAGINFKLCLLGNESLITRARNEIISQFVNSDQYTHLLFLDGDIRFDGEDLRTLINYNKDVIGARVPLKRYFDEGDLKYNTGKELARIGKLSLVTRVGTAVFLLSRKAAKDLARDAEENGRVYRINKYLPDIPQRGLRYDIFRTGIRNGEYLSEDFWVCYQLRELGYGIYVDLAISTGHSGVITYAERPSPETPAG